MQLQGIVFIQLQVNDILVNCKLKKFIQRTYNLFTKRVIHSRQLYFFTGIIFISRNVSVHSTKYILVQGKHIHSGTLYPLKDIYSFKEHLFIQAKALCSFKELYLLNIDVFADIA